MARKSQWQKGVEIYKDELKELLKERLEEKGFSLEDVKKLSYKDASAYILGGLVDKYDYLETFNKLKADYLRWIDWSQGGESYIYDDDIKEILFTASEKKRYPGNYVKGESILQIQGRACYQAFRMLYRELKAENN